MTDPTLSPHEIAPERLAFYESHSLDHGPHASFSEGACAMEMVAYLAGEPHGDHPECTCPVLAAFVRSWNDCLPDEDRDRLLKPVLPKLIGTRTNPATEKARSLLAMDWFIREYTPTWLETVDELREHAAKLRAHAEITDEATAAAVAEDVRAAHSAAHSAAYSAAHSAAYPAAHSAAHSAAYSGPGLAAGSAAGLAAHSAAHSAAYSAAHSAAHLAAHSAAYSAARDGLAPTVAKLQESALDLLERMVAVEVAS